MVLWTEKNKEIKREILPETMYDWHEELISDEFLKKLLSIVETRNTNEDKNW